MSVLAIQEKVQTSKCLLFPQKQTLTRRSCTLALCQKQTLTLVENATSRRSGDAVLAVPVYQRDLGGDLGGRAARLRLLRREVADVTACGSDPESGAERNDADVQTGRGSAQAWNLREL